MDYKRIAREIINLKKLDLALRNKLLQNGKISLGYNQEMKRLYNKSAKILNDIMH